MNDGESLSGALQSAEETLKSSLREACRADVAHVAQVDTGELIKVEEMLAIASDAAKHAISIRRKRKQSAASATSGSDVAVAAIGAGGQRRFVDSDGMEWLVRAVHPAERDDMRHARLLGTYQQGWLAFECATGKRRLSPIPTDWADLDEAALRALCRVAAAAPRRDDRAQ